MTLVEQLLQLLSESLGTPESGIRADVRSGLFSLLDPYACGQCPEGSRCDNATLNVESANGVAVIGLSDWFKSLPPVQGLKNCDYLMCDSEEQPASRKVALCDLTCSREKYLSESAKYPGGKREYVVTQMLSTADFLSGNEMLRQQLQTATSRRFIFGVRISDPEPTDPAAKSMHAFMRTPSSTSLLTTSLQKISDIRFDFVEVRYPHRLAW